MARHPSARGGRPALAGLIALLLAPAPAAAGASAALTVRARVIDRCEIRLPDLVPPHVRRHLPEHVRDLIVHRCHRPVHPHIEVGWLPWPFLGHHHRARSVDWHRHHGRGPGRGRVLITISY